MKFKDIIKTVSDDTARELKKWRRDIIIIAVVGMIMCDICGLVAGYMTWGYNP